MTRPYDTRRWRRLREAALDRDDGLCRRCRAAGLTAPASVVHHVRPVGEGGEPWDLGNLESLCRACHESEHGRAPSAAAEADRAAWLALAARQDT